LRFGFLVTLAALCASTTSPSLAKAASSTEDSGAAAGAELKPDPQVKTGVLPNGMRFVLRRNATPLGEVSIRLRIATGSLNETAQQRGVAHLLEHLVLNGTRNVPEGEFFKRSERLGLRPGADTNATTDFQQTVYRLDLPKNDNQTVGTALFLLREIADRATLDAGALERERSVILAEERARSTPEQTAEQQAFAWHFRGQPIQDRLPIGTVDSIRSVPHEQVLAFYHAWYRPENATLIIVGDIDPESIVARVRSGFNDWKGDGPAGIRPDEGKPTERHLDQAVITNPQVPLGLSATWLRPADLGPDSRAKRNEDLREGIVVGILNQRLQKIAQQDSAPPFTRANLRVSRVAASGKLTAFSFQARAGDWRTGLSVIAQEQHKLLQFGVTASEIDTVLKVLRTSFRTLVRGGETLPSRGLADQLLAQVNNKIVPISPEAQLELFEEATRGLQPDSLREATQRLFSGSGPLLYVTTPVALPPGSLTPAELWARSQALAVKPPAEEAQVAWPYEPSTSAGRILERKILPDLGTTVVHFANGVRLLVRPNTLRNDQVLVRVSFGNGRLAFPATQPSPEWAFGSALIGGGTTQLSMGDLQRSVAGKITGLSLSTDDDSFALSGGTRTEDLPTQLQLMAAYLREPGWRSSALEQMRASGARIHQVASSSPGGVLNGELGSLLRGGDRRYRLPPLSTMLATSTADIRRLLEPELSTGRMEVIIAGDVQIDEAINLVAVTFGALPPRQEGHKTEPAPVFPSASTTPIRLTHSGRADQAMAAVMWPTLGLYGNLRQSRVLNVLGVILQQRMLERLREEMGSTYVPQARHSASTIWDSYGYMMAASETPPERLNDVRSVILELASDLASRAIQADELDRALRPMLLNFERERASNEYWLRALQGLSYDDRVATVISNRATDYRTITPAELQVAAREFLKPDRAVQLEVVKALSKSEDGVIRVSAVSAEPQ